LAKLKAIQRGSATIAGGATSVTVTITSVDLAKTFLKFTFTGNVEREGKRLDTIGYLNSATQVKFERLESDDDPINIEYFVVEFSSGVAVQRGSEANIQGTRNVTISAVTLAKSFVLLNGYNGYEYGIAWDSSLQGTLTTTTNLALYNNNSRAYSSLFRWEVVEYDSCSVQRSTKTMSSSGTTDSTTISAVTTGKTMISLNGSTEQGTGFFNPSKEWVCYLSATTTVSWVRGYGDTSVRKTTLEVVSFSDPVAVTRFQTAFAIGDTSKTITVALADVARAFMIYQSIFHQQWNSSSATSDTKAGFGRGQLNSATQAQINREAGTYDQGTFYWELVEFLRDNVGILCFCPSPTFTGEAW